MRSLWEMNSEEDNWGVLLIDTRNDFNEGNLRMMAWVARYEWPSGCMFLVNIHRHHSLLAMRGDDAKNVLSLKSQESCTQGHLLAMVGYGLSMVRLIRAMKINSHPLILHGMLMTLRRLEILIK